MRHIRGMRGLTLRRLPRAAGIAESGIGWRGLGVCRETTNAKAAEMITDRCAPKLTKNAVNCKKR